MNRLIVLGVLSGCLILLTKCGADDSAPHSVQENASGENKDVDSSAYFENAILNDATVLAKYAGVSSDNTSAMRRDTEFDRQQLQSQNLSL